MADRSAFISSLLGACLLGGCAFVAEVSAGPNISVTSPPQHHGAELGVRAGALTGSTDAAIGLDAALRVSGGPDHFRLTAPAVGLIGHIRVHPEVKLALVGELNALTVEVLRESADTQVGTGGRFEAGVQFHLQEPATELRSVTVNLFVDGVYRHALRSGEAVVGITLGFGWEWAFFSSPPPPEPESSTE